MIKCILCAVLSLVTAACQQAVSQAAPEEREKPMISMQATSAIGVTMDKASQAEFIRLPRSTGPSTLAKIKGVDCVVSVSFGSFAMGPNRPVKNALDKMLRESGDVVRVTTQNWGREGEIDYCIEMRKTANKDVLVAEIEAMIRKLGQSTGPVSLRY